MVIHEIRAMWQEKEGFDLESGDIGEQSIFVHFITPVIIYIGGKAVRAEAGACIIWDVHAARHFVSEGCELLHDWFHSDADFIRIAEEYGLKPEHIYYPAFDSEITDIISDTELEHIRGGRFCRELEEASIRRMCIKLARAADFEGEIPDTAQRERFLELRREIHSRFAEEWNVKRMAETVRMSESRFFSVYKRVFGISPMSDLERTRIRRAELYLKSSDCTVAEAAEYAGYNNQYHFIRRFKKNTGVTPGKYKRGV